MLMILIFLKPNLKIRVSQEKKDLKSTPKKSNKHHQYKHSRGPAIVKLNPDGSYGWEKIVTRAGAAHTRPQVQQYCINCGVCMGEYFCGTCKFFDDDEDFAGNLVIVPQFQTLLCGLIGLPPSNVVLPQSPMHTKSLAVLKK
ncbi:HCO3- transporter family [Trifolium repens]|nr:HCO3- transporter family [Trifolium repens]